MRFIKEARDTAEASVARRDDLSHDFEILDDFLAELRPTLAELENAARANTPLLTDLRAAAPGLNQLALNLPAVQRREPGLARQPRGGVEGRQDGARPRARRDPPARRVGQEGAGHRRDAGRLPARPRRPPARGRDRRPGPEGHRARQPEPGPVRHQGLHRPRGPPQLRLLPGRRRESVRSGRAPPALHASTTSTTGRAASSRAGATPTTASPAYRPRTAGRRPTSSTRMPASAGSARTSRASTRT